MKIVALSVQTYRSGQTENSVQLAAAYELSSFGYFTRSSVKEMCTFVSRTFLKRTPRGQRQSVEHEEYIVHCYLRSDGLGAVCVSDREYPPRVAFTLINQLLEQFDSKHRNKWPTTVKDTAFSFPEIDKAITEYQDPAKADKITRIQKDLDDTMNIMHKTIDNVLERGVKLDTLVQKSDDLSMQSKAFYKTAKKHNSCCVIA